MAKRVFILGAGFSRQAGMPVANELTPLMAGKLSAKAQEWLNWLQELIKWANGETSDHVNIEQLFDIASFSIEFYKMQQQLNQPNNKPASRQPKYATWLRDMEDVLIDIIYNKQKDAMQKLAPVEKFSSCLNDNDTVLTFNYDTLLEESLDRQNIKRHYGFKKEKGSGVEILKMHGSINWLMVCRNQSNGFKYQVLAENSNTANTSSQYDTLLQVPSEDIFSANKPSQIKVRHLQNPGMRKEFAIAGLGSYKPLNKLVGSGEVWNNNA